MGFSGAIGVEYGFHGSLRVLAPFFLDNFFPVPRMLETLPNPPKSK